MSQNLTSGLFGIQRDLCDYQGPKHLMCPGPGEEAEAAPIDGSNIPLTVVKIAELKAGKPQANPFIRPGDYIIVSEAEPVYITGSVVSPQGVYARDQLTLSTALAMVGGLTKEARVI